MIELGKVVKTDDNCATVRFARQGECDKCRICKVVKDGFHSEMSINNILGVCEGDFVKVEIYKKKVRVISVLLYFIPLFLTAIGAGIGMLMSIGASIILAIAGFVVGIAFAVPIDVCVVRKKNGFSPQMISVVSETEYIQTVNAMKVACQNVKTNKQKYLQ